MKKYTTRDPQPTARDPEPTPAPPAQDKPRLPLPCLPEPVLKCPACSYTVSRINGTVSDPDNMTVRRYRSCGRCGKRFVTSRPMDDQEQENTRRQFDIPQNGKL